MDIAKRLLDFGFHAPTVYFPLVVPEALMIEPTETESKETLDAFADTLAEDPRGGRRVPARRPAHAAHQPARRGQGGQGADPAVETLTCRLLPYDFADGPTNMAADEVLLLAAEAGVASLRFYGWSSPTLSLGYFQSEKVCRADPLLGSLPFVRRPTGGQALVHHHELTYALAVPGGRWLGCSDWTCRMHAIIAAALKGLGVGADTCTPFASCSERASLAPGLRIHAQTRPPCRLSYVFSISQVEM